MAGEETNPCTVVVALYTMLTSNLASVSRHLSADHLYHHRVHSKRALPFGYQRPRRWWQCCSALHEQWRFRAACVFIELVGPEAGQGC